MGAALNLGITEEDEKKIQSGVFENQKKNPEKGVSRPGTMSPSLQGRALVGETKYGAFSRQERAQKGKPTLLIRGREKIGGSQTTLRRRKKAVTRQKVTVALLLLPAKSSDQ